jgi:hypothetical protein
VERRDDEISGLSGVMVSAGVGDAVAGIKIGLSEGKRVKRQTHSDMYWIV